MDQYLCVAAPLLVKAYSHEYKTKFICLVKKNCVDTQIMNDHLGGFESNESAYKLFTPNNMHPIQFKNKLIVELSTAHGNYFK